MKMVIGKQMASRENPAKRRIPAFGVQSESGEVKESKSVMTEIKSKRGRRSKFYSDGQKKMKAEFYDSPVHFYNAETGEYEEIDNRFEDKGETYGVRSNAFKPQFNKKVRNGKIFEMEKDLCKVGLKSLDAAKYGRCELEICDCGNDGCDSGKALLKNATDNTDIEYCVTTNRIKENIIVKERADKYEYDFELSIENIVIDVSEDGKNLELIKKDSGMTEFYLPSPVMFDAAGETSDSVYYEIEQENAESIKIKVIADKEWINAEGRVFPVTIDPQIVTKDLTGAYYYDNDYENSVFKYNLCEDGEKTGGNPRLYYNATTGKEIYTEIVIQKNKLPSYIRNHFTSVKLKLRIDPTKNNKFGGFSVGYESFYVNDPMPFEADVTHYFYSTEDEIVIQLSNYHYRGDHNENDIYFFPPTLVIEYESHIVSLYVSKSPNKTTYIPGEKFDSTGMIVKAKYEDNRTETIANAALKFEPSGTLATYDKSVKIIYKSDDGVEYVECNQAISIESGDYWFNDRRASEGMEDIYTVTLAKQDGTLTNEKYIIKLEHADGVDKGSEREGTPLNAETFNKILKTLKDKNVLS